MQSDSLPRKTIDAMGLIKLISLIIIIGFTNTFVFSQSFNFDVKSLSINEGLSNNTINSIVEDKHGFIWIGTEDGLNRYDGYTIKKYWHDPNDSSSIPSNYIRKILKDYTDRLWFYTNDGIARYDTLTDSFIIHKEINGDDLRNYREFKIFNWNGKQKLVLSSQYVVYTFNDEKLKWEIFDLSFLPDYGNKNINTFFYKDSKGRSWISFGYNDLICFTDKKIIAIYDLYQKRKNNPQFSRYGIIESKRHGIICTTQYGIYKYDEEKGIFTLIKKISFSQNDLINPHKYLEDSQGRLWLYSYQQKLSLLLPNSLLVNVINLNNANGINNEGYSSYYEDSQKRIWFNGRTGLFFLNSVEDKFKKIEIDNSSSFSYGSSLIESRSGAYFVGTVYNGVKILYPKNRKIISYSKEKTNKNSLSQNSIYEIIEGHENKLWLQTQDEGFSVLNRSTNSFTNLFPATKEFNINQKALCNALFNKENELIVGTKSAGMFVYNTKTKSSFQVKGICGGRDVTTFYIRLILPKNERELFVGTRSSGLFLYDRINHKFVKQLLFFDQPIDDASNQILCMLKKGGDVYWIGTDAGMYEFDIKTQKVLKHYNKKEKDNTSLPQPNVFSLFRDSYNNVWVGTYGGGLCKFDYEKGTFKTWNLRNGFPSNCIMAIIEDNKKKLWVTTTNGIVRFDPLTEDYKIYKKEDGFLGNEFNTDSGTKLSTGEIAVGGTDGLNIFNPDELQENKYIPPIRLTKLFVNNEERKIYPDVTVSKEIHLYPEDKIVEFEFAALSFIHPENNKYAFMLKGFSDNWVKNGTKRSATFTNLDPGDYVLYVKASNNDGIWNDRGISLAVIVHPPYYATWWFRTLLAVFLIGIIYYLYKQRIERFKIVEETRNRIAENLHDEFGGRISSIGRMVSSLSTISGIRTNDEANSFIERITEQSKLVGEDLKDIVWSLLPENDDWESLLVKYRRFAADLFENHGIQFSIEIDKHFPKANLNPEQRINYLMTLKEISNNIVKHSNAKHVDVKIAFVEGFINTVVEDNGIGFETNKEYSGIGLRSIVKRLKILAAQHELISKVGEGTKWIIKIKL